MAWIESHQSLATHRKTMLLEEALGITTPQAIGHLHLLWWWALDNAPTGSLQGISDGVIARAVQWHPDDAFTFVDAMQFAGFIDKDTRMIHDWAEYAGRLIAKREANAERMREQRATQVQGTTSARTGATVPNPTVPNSTQPYDDLFDFWNGQNITVHRKLTRDMRSAIDSARTDYSLEEIKQAIANYAEILHGVEYYFSYKWTLAEFLSRRKGNNIERFLDSEVARENFGSENGQKPGAAQGHSGKRELTAQELADTWRD